VDLLCGKAADFLRHFVASDPARMSQSKSNNVAIH
jgi:hypothetical protein